MKCLCPKCLGPIRLSPSQRGAMTSCPHCAAAFQAPVHIFTPGAIFEDFLMDRELGRGASGIVFRCRQMTLDRVVAVKVLSAGSDVDTEAFIREARIVARLNHPNIVQAFAALRIGDCRLLAMECVEGPSVKDLLRIRGALAMEEAIRIVRETALALDCAWSECHLIHRDVKPGNILLDGKTRVKLTDFGLACTGRSVAVDDDRIEGTPLYIPPEAISGAPSDHRADQYSLGAVLYHLLTGVPPFTDHSLDDLLDAHLHRTPQPPSAHLSSISKSMDEVVLTMLEKDPSDRYNDYDALISALDQAAERSKGLRHGLTTVIRRIARRD